MRKLVSGCAVALLAIAAVGVAQAGKPINAKCPVKGTPAKPDITVNYKGQVIGFCWGGCKSKFAGDPEGFADRIPELKATAKKSDKPNPTGPCECKKIVKGYYCTSCKRELGVDDVRGNVCKRCETKPAEIEYCLKLTPKNLTPQQLKKTGPQFDEDKARVSYECETCAAKGELEDAIKHKPDCKPKFGGGLKKVCAKSGKFPHASDDK